MSLSIIGLMKVTCSAVVLQMSFLMNAHESLVCLLAAVGPTLMAVWSKALPLTARCLSPLSGLATHPGHVGMLLMGASSCDTWLPSLILQVRMSAGSLYQVGLVAI